MSDYVELSAAGIPHQSIVNVLSPGIISLFIQGLETGLVFSQFAQWLALERRDGLIITLLVLFVTTVGLLVNLPPSFLKYVFSRDLPLTAWRLQYVLRLHGEFTFIISDNL